MGHRGLLLAAGRDLQNFALDHLKFVQVNSDGSGMSELDRGGIVQEGRMVSLYLATKVSVVKPLLDPFRAFMTLRALAARSI